MIPADLLNSLPHPAEKRLALHITRAGERALREGHPWLFADSIQKQSHDGQPGDLAVIFDSNRRFLAIGLYDPESPVRVKILHHHQPAPINQVWFAAKITAALERRAPLAADAGTTGYRLIYGENDGLPGLVVDQYAETLVMKLYTPAWFPHLRDVLPPLLDLLSPERVVLRLSRRIQAGDSMGLADGQVLLGTPPDGPVQFLENGLHFTADVIHGHKTGYFFDQRENRALVRRMARGRQVLDVFTYSGGFAVNTAAGGAEHITAIDSSAPALEAAHHHLHLNGFDLPFTPLQGDAFAHLQQLQAENAQFNLIIIDPPTFAARQDTIPDALNAYHRLATLAAPLLAPRSVFVMASCSSRVPATDFFKTVVDGVESQGRRLLVQQRTAHALDHPVTFPEGAYLKCLFATTIE